VAASSDDTARQDALERYRYIINLARDCISFIDADYRYVIVNEAYCSMVNRRYDDIVGRTVPEIWGAELFQEQIKPRLERALQGYPVEYTTRFRFEDAERPREVRLFPYYENGDRVTHVVAFTREVEPSNKALPWVDEQDYRDRLTGLYNRETMEVSVTQQLLHAERSTTHPLRVLLFISLRNFKTINRMHGHQISDVLLENTARRMSKCLRKSDFIFRFDSNNFVILITEITRSEDASLVAQKIHDQVIVPYRVQDADLHVGCYIGIAVFPRDAENTNELIKHANSASVEAEDRDQPFLFYDEELHRRAVSRDEMHTQLRRAFEADEFRFLYQPLVGVKDGRTRIVGAEALLRWNHPRHGLLLPASFLRLAEETHLVLAIDKWALFEVCRTIAQLVRLRDLVLSVNISSLGFIDPHFTEIVQGALHAAGNPDPRHLRIEVTESMSIGHVESATKRVKTLQEMGIDVWIDDFGVGQSSLAMLRSFPARGVKVDRSFLDGVEDSRREREYLQSIIFAIKARERMPIVEGITNRKRLEIAYALGGALFQGYYIGHPRSRSRFARLLSS